MVFAPDKIFFYGYTQIRAFMTSINLGAKNNWRKKCPQKKQALYIS